MATDITVNQLSFRDVLQAFNHLGHQKELHDLALKLGYKFYLWNDQVFEVKENEFINTGLTKDNVL